MDYFQALGVAPKIILYLIKQFFFQLKFMFVKFISAHAKPFSELL